LAVFLVYVFVGMVFSGAGWIIADHSTTPPTLHIVGQFRDTLPAIVIAFISLVCIHIGIWKRRALEIVGWGILLAFIFAGMIFA
jgi:hypothetical protein